MAQIAGFAPAGRASTRPVAAVLVLLQAGSAVLTAIGGLVMARLGEPAAGVGALASLGLAAGLGLGSIGVVRGSRWARGLTIGVEIVGLAGTALTMAIHQGPTGLASFTNDVALPLLVIWTLR